MTDKDDLIRGPSADRAEAEADTPFPTEGSGSTPREQWEAARLDAGGALRAPGSEPAGTDAGDAGADKLGDAGGTPADGTAPSGA
jgi:hypothetical protein